MEILKSYRYRLEPTEEQKVLLNKHFGSTRFIYNHFLNEKNNQYKETKKSDNYNKQAIKLTYLKNEEGTIWLNEVNSQCLQQSLKNLETAFKNFFKKTSKYPKFKSGIKLIEHRPFEGNIKQCTFSKDCRNKYFVSILVETHTEPLKPSNKSVGIDLVIKDFVITSDGKKYENKLKVAQRHLSRKIKGSHQYEKQRLKVAKFHEKISNSRKDNLHKVSIDLIKSYDIISLEDLNIKRMLKNHTLAKHIADCG